MLGIFSSIYFYLHEMPSRHVNDAENNILKLISDHTKKAFYLFFGIKMIMILMERFRKLARDFVRFISEDNLFPRQPIMVPWTDSVSTRVVPAPGSRGPGRRGFVHGDLHVCSSHSGGRTTYNQR